MAFVIRANAACHCIGERMAVPLHHAFKAAGTITSFSHCISTTRNHNSLEAFSPIFFFLNSFSIGSAKFDVFPEIPPLLRDSGLRGLNACCIFCSFHAADVIS